MYNEVSVPYLLYNKLSSLLVGEKELFLHMSVVLFEYTLKSIQFDSHLVIRICFEVENVIFAHPYFAAFVAAAMWSFPSM